MTCQYLRVAEAFGEEVAATFGPEKLDRALAYIARTPEDEKPAEIPELRIEVPAEDGGPAVKKPFAELTVTELRRATAAIQVKGAKPAPSRLPDEVMADLTRANRALDKEVGKAAAAGAEVRARVVKGVVLVDVRGVPLANLKAALRALTTILG